MKILNFKLIIVQSLLLIWIGHSKFYAQSTVASNSYNAGRYIGWTTTMVPIPYTLKPTMHFA